MKEGINEEKKTTKKERSNQEMSFFCILWLYRSRRKPKVVYPSQGSNGHGKSWKTMENGKIKSRPGKVMENENFAKSHGKSRNFGFFINVYRISFEKNVLITFDTQ